jgi:hypothetical protein
MKRFNVTLRSIKPIEMNCEVKAANASEAAQIAIQFHGLNKDEWTVAAAPHPSEMIAEVTAKV